MKFKPFTKSFDFKDAELVEDFPDYLSGPVARWVKDYLEERDLLKSSLYAGQLIVDQGFVDSLQINLRTTFSSDWSNFINAVFRYNELAVNLLALLIQNCRRPDFAQNLEDILSTGGSAYKVEITSTKIDQYRTSYDYEFVHRVPEVAQKMAGEALSANDALKRAWNLCYRHNPDYEKTVSACCDFLEGFLGQKYFPNDTKPQLKKFVHAFESDPSKLKYKGDSIVAPKSELTSLLKDASNIRGQHTNGQGRVPAKDEAEFVLHATIFIWNMHQK